jgi:hypothetical protein
VEARDNRIPKYYQDKLAATEAGNGACSDDEPFTIVNSMYTGFNNKILRPGYNRIRPHHLCLAITVQKRNYSTYCPLCSGGEQLPGWHFRDDHQAISMEQWLGKKGKFT